MCHLKIFVQTSSLGDAHTFVVFFMLDVASFSPLKFRSYFNVWMRSWKLITYYTLTRCSSIAYSAHPLPTLNGASTWPHRKCCFLKKYMFVYIQWCTRVKMGTWTQQEKFKPRRHIFPLSPSLCIESQTLCEPLSRLTQQKPKHAWVFTHTQWLLLPPLLFLKSCILLHHCPICEQLLTAVSER